MKYLNFLFLIVLILSCNSNSNSDKNWKKNAKTVVSGTVEPYNPISMPGEMKLFFYDDLFNQITNEIKIDSLGNFHSEFELAHPQDVSFYYRSWLSLILKPGDSIYLSFDGNQAEKKDLYASMTLAGDSKELNTRFHQFLLNDSILDNYYKPISKLTPKDFKGYHDSIFSLRNTYISEFLNSNTKIDKPLKSWLEMEKDIVPIINILEFPMYYRMYNRDKAKISEYPEDFFNSVSDLNSMTGQDFINNNIASLSNHLIFHYYEKINPNNESMNTRLQDSLLFDALEKDFKNNPLPIQLALSDKIRAGLEGMNTSFIDNNFVELESIYADSKIGEAVFETYEKTKAELAKIKMPSDAQFIDFESSDPKDYLDEIIAKADGKVVYIDHWATWCGPCIGEFKNALPDFKKKYKGDIEFVYFCYSSEIEQWKPMIRKFQLSGKHYFVTDEEIETLQKQMTVDGYPTYTIIDQKGQIIKSDFQYRPSREVTSKIIDSLLQNGTSL